MMDRIRRTVRSLLDVYRGWRVVPVLGAVVSLTALALVFPEGSRLLAALFLFLSLASLLVLHGLDVRRQDRLRAKAASMPSESRAPLSEPQRRPVPSRWSPVVTVVVTAHNEDDWLLTCLESVANQTWADFECIVVDDLSTDDTLNKAFEAFEPDPRFRFVHNERNLGLAGSRNVGLAMARGRWTTFLDADDFLYEDALAVRVDAISKHQHDPLVAGAYCGWHSVDEDAEYEPVGPPPPKNRTEVMWFDATYDAPFIASAPLIDTRVARALGGFDDSLVTAEDFEFWSRFLRQGYIILWAPVTGVAYRQRRDSMYRVTTVAHAAITSDVYRQNQQQVPGHIERVGPYLFTEPVHVYQTRLATARRLLTAYVAAEAASDRASAEFLWSELTDIVEPWMRWALSENILSKTALRVENHESDGARARASLLDHRLRPRVRQLLSGGSTDSPDAMVSRMKPTGSSHELSPVRTTSGLPSEWSRDTVLLMPSAAYHCDELGPLARELAAAGVPVGFGVIPKRLGAVKAEMRKYGMPLAVLEPEDQVVKTTADSVAAMVTLNDWGDYDKFVVAGNERDKATFGKVEGVQDFTDADVHWERSAYQQVAHVLCQGRNDFDATNGDRSIVGSTRLERIWNQPPVSSRDRIAVINLNFTYGVLTDARDDWLYSVVDACRREGIPWTVSLHPAQRPPDGLDNIATKPMRHLLTRPSVLISRFSTVPFEAMARGVPFVYHNPHGEKVSTFHNPDGAFDVTTSSGELAGALRRARSEPDYRSRCEDFFRRQVDIDPARTSEARTLEVVTASL